MSYAFDVTVNALRNDGLTEQQVIEVLENLACELGCMPVKERILDRNIKRVLTQIYMPAHFEGFAYWVEAIRICKNNEQMKMMHLYREIANKYNTTYIRVERAMRYAKEVIFKTCPLQIIKEFFGKDYFKQNQSFSIVNQEFLKLILEKV